MTLIKKLKKKKPTNVLKNKIMKKFEKILKKKDEKYRKRKSPVAMLIILMGASFIILFLFTTMIIAIKTGAEIISNALHQSIAFFIILSIEIVVVGVIIAFTMNMIRGKAKKIEKTRTEMDIYKIITLLFSAFLVTIFIISIILILMKVLNYPIHVTIDLSVFALVSAIAPISLYEAYRLSKIQAIEEELPNFLRDTAECSRAGMTLVDAIRTASYGNYGLLTPEIKKMANQLSWGIYVNDVLTQFAERVGTPLVKRSVLLTIEASRSGGNIADVLTAVAKDAKEIKMLENERNINMNVYITVIYIAFFVFLAVISILATSFLPAITHISQTAPSTAQGAGTPVSVGKIDPASILNIYYLAVLVQGFGSGLVAGVLSTGKLVHGFKHSLIMVVIAVFMFRVLF
jgi:flagellar protein FlaJ